MKLNNKYEYASILARNHILDKAYILEPGNIESLNYKLLMPYEHHLRDIVLISNGKCPNHTTGNSIRSVIETVCHFESPKKELSEYVSGNKVLAENSCIYSLCQDLSHGNYCSQQSVSKEIMQKACATVVDFMNTKYKDQIESISDISKCTGPNSS